MFIDVYLIQIDNSLVMSRNKKNEKVCINNSTITGTGKGLFAKVVIKQGSIIAEYRGKLRNNNQQIQNLRSVIYFNDNTFLECPSDDLASYANDAINFTGIQRKIMETLKADAPFYTKHKSAVINSTIKINTKLHRAFLIATRDIPTNQEIFCHYGFSYWFGTEMTKIGFLQEAEIEENGFPDKIFEYPAFARYIEEFYPDCTDITVKPFGPDYDVVLDFGPDNHIVMVMKNYSNVVQKIDNFEKQVV